MESQMSAQTILITGAAGFIGSHTSEALLRAGRTVIGLDNFDPFYDPAIKRRNLRELKSLPGFEFVEGDIRDEALLDSILGDRKVDGVIHLAARAGVRPSIDDPVLYSSVNVDGTTRLLEACRRHGVDRFLFGSSSSVYGNNDKVPFAEEDRVDHPISPYAATKKAGELICHTYHLLFGMQIDCLRFFTVFGPRQRPEMAIHKFTRLLADGAEIDQYGDGTSARDYTFVSDIVAGIVAILDRPSGYSIWNLGGSRTTTLADLVDKIAKGLDVEPRVRVLADQPGDVRRTYADVDKAKRELGWSPEVTIDQGLE
jgi:UDP-glucuronate 4-epimerase